MALTLEPQIASDFTLRLSDFGMSLIMPSTTPTDPIGLGTPSYSAPELVKSAPSPFSFPADIFSLGVTLSVLLTGHEPFSGMRAVERMFKVAQGGYWAWEERRRGDEADEESDYGGSRPSSRAGSAKGGLSRHGSQKRPISRTSSVRSNRSTRSRADSLDEQDQDSMTAFTRDALVTRLLVDDDGLSPSHKTTFELPSSPRDLSPPIFPFSDDAFGFARLATDDAPPDSPSDEFADGSHMDLTYPDGTSYQYFSGGDMVPVEVRNLLRSMTRSAEWERPTASEVLRRLAAIG